MSQKTKIEWTEATWNPVSGCTKVSVGCDNCYAETMANRLKAMGTKGYENGFEVTTHLLRLYEPQKRKKPTIYFVCSMGDLFHSAVSFEFIDAVFQIMSICPQHTFQILTKRPERMQQFLKKYPYKLPNVWLGVTAENQEQADKRIPILLDTLAALRFVSIEPMHEKINLQWIKSSARGEKLIIDALKGEVSHVTNDNGQYKTQSNKLDWVIVGGETGTGARPLRYEWVKDIQGQCKAAKVPFFFKKWGKTAYCNGQEMTNVRLFDGMIDGVECRCMP